MVFIFFVGFFLAHLYTSIPVCRYTVKFFSGVKINNFLTIVLCIYHNIFSFSRYAHANWILLVYITLLLCTRVNLKRSLYRKKLPIMDPMTNTPWSEQKMWKMEEKSRVLLDRHNSLALRLYTDDVEVSYRLYKGYGYKKWKKKASCRCRPTIPLKTAF